MTGVLSAQGVAEGGCARRLNLGPYTVFVSTFYPRGSRYHHGHDDLLSYVVYYEGDEVLCDPGRPSYVSADRSFASSAVHNGLRSALPLRIAATPFVPVAFAEPLIQVRTSGNRTEIEASNQALEGWKNLTFGHEGASLVISERVLPHAPRGAPFTHCLACDTARLASDFCVIGGAFELTYEGLQSLRIERSERSVDYGERLPCTRLTGQSPTATSVTRLRHV